MKTVFRSNEIAHVWANKLAPRGRSPGNMSFNGDAIISWSTVIARRINHNGREAYIYDGHRFSNSTSKTQSHIRRAIADSSKLFVIDAGKYNQSLDWTPTILAAHYIEKAKELETVLPSKFAFKRAEQYNRVTAYLKQALDVCQYFGIGCAVLSKQIAKREAGEANAADILKTYRQKRIDSEQAAKVKAAKAQKARNIQQARDYIAKGERLDSALVNLDAKAAALATLPDDLRANLVALVTINNAKWTEAKRLEHAAKVAEWRAGQAVNLPHDAPTMLRTEENEMVTSKGARVPLSDARKTYRFVTAKRSKGWHKNGETHAIGGYQLEAVNEAGVVVGCHRVTWEEIERFASSQGWEKN